MKITELKDKKIIIYFFIWRLFLFLLDFISIKVLPFKASFPYSQDILAKLAKPLFWQWANFDGVHYIMIAQNGYRSIFSGITQAFFPFYPILIKYLNFLIRNYLFSGLIISNLFFLLSLLVFKKLLIELKINSIYPLLFLLIFPTSYYFGAVYNESLFLFLSLMSVLMIKKKKWLLSSFLIGFSTATRITGVFLITPLLGEYLLRVKNDKKKLFNALIYGLISLSGLIIYSFYLNKYFHDPFYFATVQQKFGASRQTDKIILLYQVIWRYIKMFLTVKKQSLLFYTISQEFIFAIVGFALLIFGFYKSINKRYLLYSFLAFLLPTLTGNFSSMPRYIIVLFPIYIILDKILKNWQKKILLFIFSILLIVNTMFFLRGFWVA